MTPAEFINLKSLEFAKQTLELSRDHEYFDTHTQGYYKDIKSIYNQQFKESAELYNSDVEMNIQCAINNSMGGYHRLVSMSALREHLNGIESNTKAMEDIIERFKNRVVYKAPLFKVGQQVRIISYEHTTIHSGRPSQYNIGDIMVIKHANGNILSDDDYNFVHGLDVEIVEDELRDMLLNRSWSEHTRVGECCIALYDYFRKANIQKDHKLLFEEMRKQVDGSISDHDFITSVFYLTRNGVNILNQLFYVDLGEEGKVDVDSADVLDMIRTGKYFNPVTLQKLTPEEFGNTIITYFVVTHQFIYNKITTFSLQSKYVDNKCKEIDSDSDSDLTEYDYLISDQTFASLYKPSRCAISSDYANLINAYEREMGKIELMTTTASKAITENFISNLTALVDEEHYTMPSGLTRDQKMDWILKTAEEIKNEVND